MESKRKRVQPTLGEVDRRYLEEISRYMDASSESEAIRRMIRFCYRVIMLTKECPEEDVPSVWANGQRIIVPF